MGCAPSWGVVSPTMDDGGPDVNTVVEVNSGFVHLEWPTFGHCDLAGFCD